jgi:chitodextrinase
MPRTPAPVDALPTIALRQLRGITSLWTTLPSLLLVLTALGPADAQTTAMGSLAAQMQPGTWAELVTNNIKATLGATTTSLNILGYATGGAWDPLSQQYFFIGSDHGEPPRFVSYSAKTNTWQRLPSPAWFAGDSMHGYDHTTIDPATGTLYHRKFGSGRYEVWKYHIATAVWSRLPDPPAADYQTCCMGLAFFPELNGLVMFNAVGGVGDGVLYLFNVSTQKWTSLARGLTTASTYNQFAEYNTVRKVVLFGDQKIYGASSTGTVTALKPAPVSLRVVSAVVNVDPVSGNYVVLAGNRAFYRYDIALDAWTTLPAPPQGVFTTAWSSSSVTSVVGVPVSSYGVMMFISCNLDQCRVHLYKHTTAGSGQPVDNTAPTVALAAPATNTTVSGTAVTVSAVASDDTGVVGVQFKLDGVTLAAEDTTSPYSIAWDTTKTSGGSHALTAVARDAAGNTATSPPVTVTVQSTTTSADTQAPSVTFSAPAALATLSGAVTVAASATDNVAVQGVQFKLDGVNLGAKDLTPPYSLTWDTSTAPDGRHVLTAVASDAAGNSTTSAGVTVTVNNQVATTADSDFAARCATPGVVRCFTFDDQAATSPYLDAGGWASPVVDTAVKASGGGSLKFTIPSNSGANASGDFQMNFTAGSLPCRSATCPGPYPTQFGDGQEFYVQWRQRFSPEMLDSGLAQDGWKQIIIGEGDRVGDPAFSCTDNDVVMFNGYNRRFPQMYHSCGAKVPEGGSTGAYEGLEVPVSPPLGDFMLQNGTAVQPCRYVEQPGDMRSGCFRYRPNEWMTFMIRIKVNGWFRNDGNYLHNDTIQLWAARQGQPFVLVLDRSPEAGTGYDIYNPDPSLVKFGKLWLLPYITAKDTSVSHPTGYTWYDEVIVSSGPIPAPGGATLPPADTTAPSVPAGLTATVVSSSQINLAWSASTDNVGVTGYRIYRNGSEIASTSSLAYQATGLAASTTYAFQVGAYDAAGNTSAQSPVASATTQAAPSPSTGLLSITNLVPTRYRVASLGVGSQYYIDRTYTLSSIPTLLAGGQWIKTANDDKFNTSSAFLSFSINQPATVYVAYSQLATVLPAWLSGWTNTGTTLQTTDRPLRVYSRAYPAGTVTLGGNWASPAAGSEEMYVVLVKGAGDTTQPTVAISAPAAGATVSGTIAVSATAFDDVGIAGVQFKLDGVNLGAEDTTNAYSVSWNTATAAGGAHTLTAVARDAVGNQTTSAAVTVTVNNSSSLAITNVVPTRYQVATLSAGSTYYIDRSYTLPAIPGLLTGGALWVKTANDDKFNTSTSFLSFTVNQPVTVYVSYKQNISALPAWLSGWTYTGTTWTVRQITDLSLRVYSKSFPAGSITLGGNSAAPASGSIEMYLVTVTAAPSSTAAAAISSATSTTTLASGPTQPPGSPEPAGPVLSVTPSDPWCSRVNTATPGTHIVFAPGTYAAGCRITAVGSPDAPIVLRSQSDTPGTQATFIHAVSAPDPLLDLQDVAHLVLRGFVFAATPPDVEAIRIGPAHDLLVEANAFAGLGGHAFSATAADTQRLTLRDNTFLASGVTPLVFGCPDGSCRSTDLLLEDNVIDGVTAGPGLTLALNSSAIVRRNTIAATHGPGVLVAGSALPTAPTLIEQNYIEGALTDAGVLLSGGPALVRNNALVANALGGLRAVNPSAPHLQQHIWLVHNTLLDNATAGISVADWAPGADNVIAFNAIRPLSGTPVLRPTAPSATVLGNFTCTPAGSCFVQATTAPYDLTPGLLSPLRDAAGAGLEPWRPVDDFFGLPRGAVADVGAFER